MLPQELDVQIPCFVSEKWGQTEYLHCTNFIEKVSLTQLENVFVICHIHMSYLDVFWGLPAKSVIFDECRG